MFCCGKGGGFIVRGVFFGWICFWGGCLFFKLSVKSVVICGGILVCFLVFFLGNLGNIYLVVFSRVL